MTAVNGHTFAAQPPEHVEPLLLVMLGHDGSAQIGGCIVCADPDKVAAMLRKLADTVHAHPLGDPGDMGDVLGGGA